MRKRIRVLHIIQNMNYGGMERLLADLVRHVDPDRFDSQILALQYLGRFSEGIERYAKLHTAARLPRYSLLWPAALGRQIGRIAPDIVHTHSGVWYKASVAARRAGVPAVVHTDHGRRRPDPWQDRLLDGLASRQTDLVVAVSAALADQLSTTVVRDAARVRVITNGVDTEVYRPRSDTGVIRRELGLAPEIPILGSIGRLEWIKGYDIMLAAFGKLRAGWGSGPAPVLVLAGDGSQRPALEASIERHSLRGAVRLLGWRDDVQALHEAFTLFTMSSRSEGTSVSLLEAMSAGLCPVVTSVGGNAAVLGEELRHRLVPSEDPDALAAAYREALLEPAGREADSIVARRRVEANFGVKTMARAYETLYTMVLPPAGGGEAPELSRSRMASTEHCSER